MEKQRRILVIFLSVLIANSGNPAASADQSRFIDVVRVTWAGAEAPSVSIAEIEKAIGGEVNIRWRVLTTLENDSKNRGISFVHGRSLDRPIILNRPMSCEGTGASSFMSSVQVEAYKQLGISDWGSRYLIILAPDNGCIWMGRALIGSNQFPGGVITLHDSASAFVITHELGHTLGLGHSNFLRCSSGAKDGEWGADCKAIEYGGAIDVMSNVDVSTPLSTYHQWRMGLLEESEIRQSWLSEEIELGASDVVNSTRAIFIRDGSVTYWIEYRRANPNSTFKPGLIVYRTDPPPLDAVISPNPEDAIGTTFSNSVGSDIWMLNWDDFTYVKSRSSGSMTLPQGTIATSFSGNVKISAKPTESANRVKVSVIRTPDKTPPPPPEIIDPGLWRTPNTSIIREGFRDGETEVSKFELNIDGEIFAVEPTPVENFSPTYLSPLVAPRTVLVRNLPEGDYNLAVRAIDLWGNTGPWSKSVKAFVDRGNPIATNNLEVIGISGKSVEIQWRDLRDEGAGLCSTLFHNPEGFVIARSNEKKSPTFSIPTGDNSISNAQVFDCLGNGITGDVSISTEFVEAVNSKRTGKWSSSTFNNGSNVLKCTGKCSASLSMSGKVSVWIGEGTADIFVGGKLLSEVTSASKQSLTSSEELTIGPKRSIIRISGRNFTFGGVSKLNLKLGPFTPVIKSLEFPDPTLSDPEQRKIGELGFNQNDFTSDWTVLPMARGTTLLDPTLDLCSATYTTEAGRKIRRQISVSKVNSPYLFLSSESVKYQSNSVAESAFRELKTNLEECVERGGANENGVFTKYSFQKIPVGKLQLKKSSSVVLVRATIGESSSARHLFGVYQFYKNYFTGMYVVTAGDKPISDVEVLRWLEVSNVLANRMSVMADASN